MIQSEFEAMVIAGIKATIAQGQPSINTKGGCVYQAGPLKCIIGHMMTPEQLLEYSSSGDSVTELISQYDLFSTTQSQAWLLSSLQTAHDTAYENVESFEARIQTIATKNNKPFLLEALS